MTNFEIIDTITLTSITGGEGSSSTTLSGGVQTPGGSGNVSVTQQQSESSTYLRCLDRVYSQRGWLESPQSVEQRQERMCAPYRTQETR
jgi:hypothetical protein